MPAEVGATLQIRKYKWPKMHIEVCPGSFKDTQNAELLRDQLDPTKDQRGY